MSDDFDTRLLDLLYGELTPAEAEAVEAELAQDAAAQQTVDGWSMVRRAVQDLPTPEPDPQVHYTVLRAAREAVEPAKPKGAWAWLSGVVLNPAFAGIAVMALAVGSVMMFQLKDEAPASALDHAADAPVAKREAPAVSKPSIARPAFGGSVGDDRGATFDKAPILDETRERKNDAPEKIDLAMVRPSADAKPGTPGDAAAAAPEGAIGDIAATATAVAETAVGDPVAPVEADGDGNREARLKESGKDLAKAGELARGGGATETQRNSKASAKGRAYRDVTLADDGDQVAKTPAPPRRPAPLSRAKAKRRSVAREAPPRGEPALRGPATRVKATATKAEAPAKAERKRSDVRGEKEARRSEVATKLNTKDEGSLDARRSPAAEPPPSPVAPAQRKAKGGDTAPIVEGAAEKRFAPPPPADDAWGADRLRTANAEQPPAEQLAGKRDGARDDKRLEAEEETVRQVAAAPSAGADTVDDDLNRRAPADDAPAAAPALGDVLDEDADGAAAVAETQLIAEREADDGEIAEARARPASKMVAPTVVVAPPRTAMAVGSASGSRARPMADSLSATGGGAPGAVPQAAESLPDPLSEARAARSRGDHRAAVGAYARYFQRHPRDGQFSRSLFEAAASHEALGQYQQALRLYDLVPSSSGQWYVRARARISALRASKAAADAPVEAAAPPESVDGDDRIEPRPEPPSVEPPR